MGQCFRKLGPHANIAAMCANCLSNVDMVAATVAATAAAGRTTAIEASRRLGPRVETQAERDERVVRFLGDLGLDPVAVLAQTRPVPLPMPRTVGRRQVAIRRWALSHIRNAPA